MKKTIEQLLELSKNPYFSLSDEERQRLDDFLSKKSEQKNRQKKNGDESEKNIPATVHNKNKVHKTEGTKDIEKSEWLEDPEYSKIGEDLAKRPAVTSTTPNVPTGVSTPTPSQSF